MSKKTNQKFVDRSAMDGQFVTNKYAKKHPATTEHEKVIIHPKNNNMKFESQFGIGADVNFITKHNKRHAASQKGTVVGVRFTEKKVHYDVKDKHFGVTNRDVDSNDVTADAKEVAPVKVEKAKKSTASKKAAPAKKAKAVKAPVAKKAAAKKSKSKK